MWLSNLFASEFLPELEKCVEQFLQQKSSTSFLNLELELHKQLKGLGDRIVETTLLATLANTVFIEQSIQQCRAKGYHVETSRKQTTVQLYGGRTVMPRQGLPC